MRVVPRRTLATLMRLTLATLMLLTLSACGEPAWKGISMEPLREIPPFSFVQSNGSTYSTAPETGRPTFVFFGYTHCPDVCPITLADWSKAKRALGADGERVRWLFVTIDPERDSASVAESYARQFDESFIGLSGDAETVAAIQKAFAVGSYQEPGASDDDYLMAHASQSFLVDDSGVLRTMYSFNSGVDAMVGDLQRLLR